MKKAELLGPLNKDTTKLVLDRLTPQDQWHLATSTGSLYRLFGKESQKSLVYSFSVIPEGALEHPIFRRYPPNYVALIKFLRIRARNQKFIAAEFPFFDYEDVWPVVAIMGNEVALRELLVKDPKQKDANGKCAIDYLAFCGHTTALTNWINEFYPDFGPEDAPYLHYYAALGGNEETVFMLCEDHHYYINDALLKGGWSGSSITLLHPAIWGKHSALIRQLINARADVHQNDHWEDIPALLAAEMGLWDFHEEFFKQQSVKENANFNNIFYFLIEAAICSNRRDKLEEIRTKRADINTGVFYVEPAGTFEHKGEYMGHAAIRSGQIELLDWGVEQGFIDIKGVFSSRRTPIDQEDKHPALFVAAIHGQLKMFDHLVEKYGLDPHQLFKGDTVLHWMIVRTTWNSYEYIAQKYFSNINLLTPDEGRSPLADAIQNGSLYNTQQYIKRYISDDIFREAGPDFIAFAEECEQAIMVKWLKFKLASLSPSAVESNQDEMVFTDQNQLGI